MARLKKSKKSFQLHTSHTFKILIHMDDLSNQRIRFKIVFKSRFWICLPSSFLFYQFLHHYYYFLLLLYSGLLCSSSSLISSFHVFWQDYIWNKTDISLHGNSIMYLSLKHKQVKVKLFKFQFYQLYKYLTLSSLRSLHTQRHNFSWL